MMSSAAKTPKILSIHSILMAAALLAVSVGGLSLPPSMANHENGLTSIDDHQLTSADNNNGDDQQQSPPPPPPPAMMMEEGAKAEEININDDHDQDGADQQDGDQDEDQRRLNIDEPFLWQMAAFAARQMSDKRLKFKLMTLTSADKSDESTYRLQLTLKRIKIYEPMAKNDVLYCTVEVIDYQQKWSLDNFGCSLPAMVRTRERTNTIRSSGLGGDKLDSTIVDPTSSSQSQSLLPQSPLSSPTVSSSSIPSSSPSSSPPSPVLLSSSSSTPSSMFMMMVRQQPQPLPPSLLPIMQAFNYHPNEVIVDHKPHYSTNYPLKPLMDNSIDLPMDYGHKRSTFKSLPQQTMAAAQQHPQPGQTFMYPSNPFPYRPAPYQHRSYQEFRPYYKFYY